MEEDRRLFESAFRVTRIHHGRFFDFYLPGMIRYGGKRGRYPAVSITGDRCTLRCEHCRGRLLEPMIKVTGPGELLKKAGLLLKNGIYGLLLSGGCDAKGSLPWSTYAGAIARIHDRTPLYLSAHVGFPDPETCLVLKDIGIQQGLIDVMGDEITASEIYHLEGLHTVIRALEGIHESRLSLVPHIVAGLRYGKMDAEEKALEIISRFKPAALVIVVLTPLKGTPMSRVSPPSALQIGRLIARARLLLPEIPISLGCERPRNREGAVMETYAVQAGATRMAVWSEEAVAECERLGLCPRFQATCCSLAFDARYRF